MNMNLFEYSEEDKTYNGITFLFYEDMATYLRKTVDTMISRVFDYLPGYSCTIAGKGKVYSYNPKNYPNYKHIIILKDKTQTHAETYEGIYCNVELDKKTLELRELPIDDRITEGLLGVSPFNYSFNNKCKPGE